VSESHRILVVGGGGREHAIAWRLARDPEVEALWVAPGNDGMARSFPCRPIADSDVPALLALCHAERITLAVIGPEAPLAAGLADRLTESGIAVFGPSAAAAQLEASKWAAKQLMERRGIPTAQARLCGSRAEALAALAAFERPWVIKADGLAAGKGVLVSEDRAEVEAFLVACFDEARFGAAGRRVLIEEHLMGEEASLMAVCDGERFVALPAARDYKRAREGDRGPNTGGMGAFAPVPRVNAVLEAEIGRLIVRPVLEEMAARGTPYRGVLYVGLMLTSGGPRVVEFNCRFGDPETQAVLPLVEGSFARLLAGAAAGTLEPRAACRGHGAVVSVAVVDEGYPGELRGGGVIEGLDDLMAAEEVLVFHASTAFADGRWRVCGGRALHVAARGESLAEARVRAYHALDRLGGPGWRCRRDIAAFAAAGEAQGAETSAEIAAGTRPGAGRSAW
jgi:phosphoribosylamine--glycine ligase